jgi:hypothetical protein
MECLEVSIQRSEDPDDLIAGRRRRRFRNRALN